MSDVTYSEKDMIRVINEIADGADAKEAILKLSIAAGDKEVSLLYNLVRIVELQVDLKATRRDLERMNAIIALNEMDIKMHNILAGPKGQR